MSNNYRNKKRDLSKLQDQNLANLSFGSSKSQYSSKLKSEFDVSNSNYIRSNPLKNYDEMEISQHLVDLYVVLRKIAKIVFITTAIILVIPGYVDGKLALNPYKPLILQLLNLLIKYSLDALAGGGDVQVFIGSPLTPISLYLNIGTFVAIIVSLPITVKELMTFVRPGLTEKEWEILKKLSKTATFLFILGALISYFVIMPVTLKVLAISGGVVGEGDLLQMYSLDSVLNLLIWGTLGGGILYASPVILLALVNLDAITPDQIAGRKKELNFAIFIIAAFVTPDPTVVSMLILSLPMILILEFIISMSYRIELEKLLG